MLWTLLFTWDISLDTPEISFSNFFSRLSIGLLLLADLSAAATAIVKAASDVWIVEIVEDERDWFSSNSEI